MNTVLAGEIVTVQQGPLWRPVRGPSWCSSCGRPDSDPVTGLLDRWLWTQHATALLTEFRDRGSPISLLVADLDRFKSVNDSAGHTVGDAVLAAVATVIRSVTRSGDLWGRYGSYTGDEFVGLLPGATLAGAVTVAQRLRRHVAAVRVPVATSCGRHPISGLSISLGVATHAADHRLADTFGRADMALLAAKRSGSDRVAVADAHGHVAIAGTTGDRQHDQR